MVTKWVQLRGPVSATGYDAIAFASYLDTKKAGTVQVGNTRVMPGNSAYLAIANGTDIQVKRTSVFEIVLCGRIFGVTQNTGASSWCKDNMPTTLVSSGLFIVTNTDEEFELYNFTKQSIFLISPNIQNINTDSYFVNPLVKITIEYMGI